MNSKRATFTIQEEKARDLDNGKDLEITIHGDVKSNGDIITAKHSVINGNMESQNASISGKIKGNLTIKSKITLKKNAHLEGDLKAAIITLEEGAKFDGMCSMVNQKLNNATTINRSFKTANEQV